MKKLWKNGVAALLALVMMLSWVPAAWAADDVKCPTTNCPGSSATIGQDGKPMVIETSATAATCFVKGEIKYTCRVCNTMFSKETGIDPNNHEYKYTDNGDGTHSAVCPYHAAVGIINQKHNIVEGRCTACMSVDYTQAKITLPENPEVYVALNSADYELTLGEVRLSIGQADITSDYNLTYSWYYQGAQVHTGDSYPLPATITNTEGDYKFVCFLMAVPKSSLTTQPISASCTVTVRVRNLLTAHATVSKDDTYISMGDVDNWSAQSVEEQIYKAAYDAGTGIPQYVVFGTKPVSKVGNLEVDSNTRYYFDRGASDLGDVRFRPSKEATGTYTINFTAYDDDKGSYPGVLTITVQQQMGDLDVFYTTAKDSPVKLDARDFEDYWLSRYSRGELEYVRFTSLPSTYEGSLYLEYTSNSRPGTRIRSRDSFYVAPGNNQYGIDELTFLPGVRQGEYVAVPFEAFGTNDRGRQTYLDGTLYIFVSSGDAVDITQRISAGGTYNFNEADFLSVYQSATGSKTGNFYIQILEIPASGTLYTNYSNGRGTRLTEANAASRPFYYSGKRGDLISSITYIPGGAASDSIRYVAYDLQGKLLYVGKMLFVAEDLLVTYASTSAGINFKASDFEGLIGTAGKLTTVAFTPPAATQGTLYYGRSATAAGTAITSDSVWYSVSTTNTTANALSMNNVSFVPRVGFSGEVSIPFSAYDALNNKVGGTVKITVTATPSTNPGTNPGTPSTPGTTPPTNLTVSFTDMPKTTATSWYYNEVAYLVNAGVLGGYEDNTFRPNGEVTYGEALKMIMKAAGYADQAPTDKHWASGYLARAQADGLLPAGTVGLDRKISRYTIAEIAAKALKLPTSARTESPFSDMSMTVTSAPYVLALYDAAIVNGTADSKGAVNYYGVNSIRRSEMAVIIYRMNTYRAAQG